MSAAKRMIEEQLNNPAMCFDCGAENDHEWWCPTLDIDPPTYDELRGEPSGW